MVTEVKIAKPDGSAEEEVIAPAHVGLTMIRCPPEECRRPPWLPLLRNGITLEAPLGIFHVNFVESVCGDPGA